MKIYVYLYWKDWYSYDFKKQRRGNTPPSGDSLSGLTTCWMCAQLEVPMLARLIHRIRILLNGLKMNESISYQNQVYFCLNVTNQECIGIWAFHIWNIKKINRKIKSFRSNKINDTTGWLQWCLEIKVVVIPC